MLCGRTVQQWRDVDASNLKLGVYLSPLISPQPESKTSGSTVTNTLPRLTCLLVAFEEPVPDGEKCPVWKSLLCLIQRDICPFLLTAQPSRAEE